MQYRGGVYSTGEGCTVQVRGCTGQVRGVQDR